MNRRILLISFMLLQTLKIYSQGFPWERPLKMAWSNDGTNFSAPTVFQDSSGVPSVIKWKGDTLVCAFQWFRVPMGSPTWDRVAVKFSYDNGISWTEPSPIVINGLPVNYQRPFDPALLAVNGDSIRIYFSSSDGMPNGGLDSTVNTYSAVSTDGVNYSFEPVVRVDEANNRVIDPSVIFFHNAFHYVSPIGSPQQGAYHYLSPDGLNFMKVPDIPSDSNHNWTGNYMVNDTGILRFYGAGRNGIWYNTTPNGGVWNGYINTNLMGGDPTAVRTGISSYLIIYVGNPYLTSILQLKESAGSIKLFPNPSSGNITIESDPELIGEMLYIFNTDGKEMLSLLINSPRSTIYTGKLHSGLYLASIKGIVRLILIEKE